MSHSRRAGSPGGPFGLRLVACGLLSLALAGVAAAATETRLAITEAALQLDENVYQLDAKLQIDLPPAARKAVDAGLTLRLEYEVEISRVRRYLPDEDVAAVVQRFELVYHALSQRYLLRSLNTGQQTDFGTLNAALEHLSDLRRLPLIDAALLEAGSSYECRIRAVLDMGNAPEALRWLLFWTDDWSTDSEWYTWTLQP